MDTKLVIVFTSNNARILHVSDTSVYEDKPSCLIDPDIKSLKALTVKGIPPHFWKRGEGSQVIEMCESEKQMVLERHQMNGVDNDVYHVDLHKTDSSVSHRFHKRSQVLLSNIERLKNENEDVCELLNNTAEELQKYKQSNKIRVLLSLAAGALLVILVGYLKYHN